MSDLSEEKEMNYKHHCVVAYDEYSKLYDQINEIYILSKAYYEYEEMDDEIIAYILANRCFQLYCDATKYLNLLNDPEHQ
ncbi:MAG: hypothetical protein ACLUFN_00520 [Eubacterium sp.]